MHLVGVEHYENFPVASWLCPPRIREAVMALYHFARTADDIADEGPQGPEARLADLRAYRQALVLTLQGQPQETDLRWRGVFTRLHQAHLRHQWPTQPLHDLLDASEQDIPNPTYPDRSALLDYCSRSANPVGKLLMHLQGVRDDRLLSMSDQICTALQLINFWQDISVDNTRGRIYVTRCDANTHGLPWPPFQTGFDQNRARALVADLCHWARQTMEAGARLPLELGGRMGLELRLVVQGGLRVLERIEDMDHQTFLRRPVLSGWDAAPVLWRALAMGIPGRTTG
jgi:squalene synthase HpnC